MHLQALAELEKLREQDMLDLQAEAEKLAKDKSGTNKKLPAICKHLSDLEACKKLRQARNDDLETGRKSLDAEEKDVAQKKSNFQSLFGIAFEEAEKTWPAELEEAVQDQRRLKYMVAWMCNHSVFVISNVCLCTSRPDCGRGGWQS